VLHGETPVRFSNALVHTLTSTGETSLSREQALELHVQARVSEELRRLEEREGEILRGVEERMEKKAEDGGNSGGDREKVRQEIEGLRARLVGLHGVGEVTEEVQLARKGLVGCLRMNDARPLDCWKEVEEFKRQARRMEKEFVVRIVGREY